MSTMQERIKERRIALDMTQEELGEKLGLKKSAIAKYENGRVENIKRSTIFKMSKVLECSASYLLGDEDEYHTPDDVALLRAFHNASRERQDSVLLLLGLK